MGLNNPGGAQVDDANTWTAKQTYSAEVELDAALNHDGSTTGFYGVAPVVQAAHIPDPAGGITTDEPARDAIDAILVVLENLGLTASA